MPGTGQSRSLVVTFRNVRFRIQLPSFERSAAAQSGLFLADIGFATSERQQFLGVDFVASYPLSDIAD